MPFIGGLHHRYQHSASLFRLLERLKNNPDCQNLYSHVTQLAHDILHLNRNINSPFKKILVSITSASTGLVKPGQTNKSLTKENINFINSNWLESEQTILTHLKSTPPAQLEKQIQSLVSVAMKEGKMHLIVGALTRLLVSSGAIKSEADVEESTGPPVALLLDWLHVLDPELRSSPDHLRQLLLFGKNNAKSENQNMSNGKQTESSSRYSQAYLLAAFTHQATWNTLEETVHSLLRVQSPHLDPGSVLDFIWAVLHVPKLWQGRERRTPRHIKNEPLLVLQANELVHLAQYILAECYTEIEKYKEPKSLQTRMSLLFYCLGNSSFAIQTLVEHLVSIINKERGSSYGKSAQFLLYQLYLKQPKIFRYLSDEFSYLVALQVSDCDDIQSLADVALHTLLTMLTTPLQEKDFRRRMKDLDIAMRKLASTHPILVLRHLPLLSASLHGISHLQFNVLRAKNYLELFNIIIGILELLQPLLFSSQHQKSFCNTLDAFMELLENHGSVYELGHMIVRLCHLLLAWVGSQGSIAGAYLSTHVNLLASLQHHHPDMTALRSLAAIAASRGTDHPTEQTNSDEISQRLGSSWEGPPVHPIMLAQARDIQARLEAAILPEDRAELFRKVVDLADRSYDAVLPLFVHVIGEGITTNHREVSDLCWDLIARLLHFQPSSSKRIARVVLSALHHEETIVAEIAVEHLPEVILLLHEYAPDLLTAAFSTCLSSTPSTTNALSDALAMLSIHTGA